MCDDYKTLNQALPCLPVLVAAMLGGGRLQSSTSVGPLCYYNDRTMRCYTNTINVLQKHHNIYATAHPWGGWCDDVNTLRPRQNGRHFADDIFKCIFLNENVWILIKFSLNFVTKGPINNIPVLVPIMAWHRPGDKPLSEPMMVSLLTHICVTRPQWVNY